MHENRHLRGVLAALREIREDLHMQSRGKGKGKRQRAEGIREARPL